MFVLAFPGGLEGSEFELLLLAPMCCLFNA